MEAVEQETVPVIDPLAKFRAQVAAENAEPRGKMSDAALAKLRTIREQEKIDDIEAGRFKTALAQVIVNPENLRTLVTRCNTSVRPPAEVVTRMAAKLNWWIEAGYLLGREIDSVCTVNSFSALTKDERDMSDTKFAAEWNLKDAVKRKASRLNRGVVDSGEPEVRLCKSGTKCLRAVRRRGAPVPGTGLFCSPACAASERARQKRGLAGIATTSIQ